MKDARGRKIAVGDKIVYSSTGSWYVTAAEVLAIGARLKAKVLSTTLYGSATGKEVTLGNKYSSGGKLENAMVVESDGLPVDLTVPLVKPLKT